MRWMHRTALAVLLGLAAGTAAAQDAEGVEVIEVVDYEAEASEAPAEAAPADVWWGNRSISNGNYLKFEKFEPNCPGICDRCDENMICCDTGCPCEKCNYICDDCENCIIWDKIFFDLDKSDLRPEGIVECNKILEYMRLNPTVNVKVQGHTCDLAPDDYNIALGQRRADSVRQYLIDNGIAPHRIGTRTFGETTPWVGLEIRHLNRRAVVNAEK